MAASDRLRPTMLQEDIVKTTCSRDCYDACGLAVYKESGVITKVLGDPDHAISLGKGVNSGPTLIGAMTLATV
jgi:Molybdopterin oxidoreductase Fe4S4 domain